MSAEEHFTAVADRILADVVTGQPVQDPQQGAAMPDTVLAEARRHHAAVCRGYDPDVTERQIDFYWASLGPAGQGGFLRTAEQRLDEGATR
jgi:hypothetical protein